MWMTLQARVDPQVIGVYPPKSPPSGLNRAISPRVAVATKHAFLATRRVTGKLSSATRERYRYGNIIAVAKAAAVHRIAIGALRGDVASMIDANGKSQRKNCGERTLLNMANEERAMSAAQTNWLSLFFDSLVFRTKMI